MCRDAELENRPVLSRGGFWLGISELLCGQLTLNSGWSRASVGAMTCHVTPLSRTPTSHSCWSAVGLLSFLVVIFGHSRLCFQAVVSASRCVGAADFEFWQVPSESRASVGALTRHITPLSHAPTSHGCWSAVRLLSHLAVIFGYSRLCFWAAVSVSRCVGAADFEFWQISSKHGCVDLPHHASLTVNKELDEVHPKFYLI